VRFVLSHFCECQHYSLRRQDDGYLGEQVPIYHTAQRRILEDDKLDIEIGRGEIWSRTTNITNSMYSSKYKLQSHSLLLQNWFDTVKANLTASLPKLFIASAETTRQTFSAILNSTCTVPHENKVDVPSLRRNILYLIAVELESRCAGKSAYIFHIFWNITHAELAPLSYNNIY
jgi:hypothetical protein